MGNRARRKELSKMLRAAGAPSRLYKGHKLRAYKSINYLAKRLQYKLQFLPGTLVNDCDATNHVVKKIVFKKDYTSHEYWPGKRRGKTFVTNVEGFEYEDDYSHCGCPFSPDVAWSVSRIEEFMREAYLSNTSDAWPLSPKEEKLKVALENGRPVVDSEGKLLPEFQF